jgi:hypothetical protein
MKRFLVFGAALVVAVGILPKVVDAQSTNGIPPVRLLDARVQGPAALAAAKAKNVLAAVAAKAGQSESKISSVLANDPSAGLDESGQLFYVEPENIPRALGSPQAAPTVAQAPFPLNQTFLLHSKPGSARVVYLDFDGTTTPASSGWGATVGSPFDLDGNPTTFNNQEQTEIQGTWQRIAEDYAAFDVDVTTRDPGLAALERSSAADLNYGSVLAFVGTTTPAVCEGCGGIAYVGTYGFIGDNMTYQPAWVIQPGVGLQKGMAEAGSHEVGHNFGLNHDGCNATAGSCSAGVGYYEGHANWAPIMGVGYYQPVSQWSKGEYAGANNTEDDIAIIATNAPVIADEPNVSIAAATDLGALSVPRSASGLVSAGGDSDYYKFTVSAPGDVRVNAFPVLTSPNLDLRLEVTNAAGTVLGSAAPVSGAVSGDIASGMDASLTVALPAAGTYYAKVTGDQTDATGDNGYTNYASLGKYSITADFGLAGDTFVPVAVTRLLDTRNTTAPIFTGTTRNLTVTGGVAGVPANATAVALNVAAVNPVTTGHLRVFPAGTPLPNASVVNFTRTKNTPNHVIAKVGAGGQISIYAGSQTHVIVDINGYFVESATGSRYTPVAAPTQIGFVNIPAATANPADSTVTIQVLGKGGNPASGVATVAVNVAVLSPDSTGHIRVYPADDPVAPNASTNNFVVGDSRTNQVLVNPSATGAIKIYNTATGPINVRVDTVGYFSASGARFKPVAPIRTLDTRDPAGSALVVGGDYREVDIRGIGSVPSSADVTAVAVNVAAVSPAVSGSIDVGPSGAFPSVQNVLHPAGENVANLVMVPVGPDGKIRVLNNSGGGTHMIVDIVGYFVL